MLRLARTTAATLDVLRVLAEADGQVWGLQVIQRSARGPGTVYPLLERLEQQGWLESAWEPPSDRRGPRRRLYELGAEGRLSAGRVLADAERAALPAPGAAEVTA